MKLAEWDAASYDALPLPHERWGADVIAELALEGHEAVLDLGCGTGRDTQRLLEALPRGRVVALDASEQMLAQLRRRLAAADLARTSVVQADLREPWSIGDPVDAVMSVATLHWLPDHPTVFESVAAALRPGGTFAADAGGEGNLATVRAVLRDLGLEDREDAWNFAGVQETRDRLTAAGFRDVEVALVADPARLQAGPQLESFLGTVILGAHLDGLPPDRRAELVAEVAARLPEPVVDYVRLRIRAVRR